MNDITYLPKFFDKGESDFLLEQILREVEWHSPINIAGVKAKGSRKMAYMADIVSDYDYAYMTIPGVSFTPTVSFYRSVINNHLSLEYGDYVLNSVLLNLYEDGKSEIRWHSDKEPQLGTNPIIPTLNLGASRKFHFLNKNTGEKTHYVLNHGDLLIMGPNCQENYLHAVLKEPEIKSPRISLTFRKVYEN